MTLLLAATAAATSPPREAAAGAPPRDTSAGAPPPRDTVIGAASVAAARISAAASSARYPIGDGSGATIAVAVTPACQATCPAADPQAIASFVGTLIHGPEVELLTVQLDTPTQLEMDCGYGAQACYYPGENRIVVSGDGTPARDGASRELVLAHEYGHHVANHRESVAPFPAAIDWGTPRWSSHERICQARRRGAIFPGDEGLRYYRNPGEAFAEAFARYRFPDSAVRWRWTAALRPDVGAFRAIREDTLNPWHGRTSLRFAAPAWSARRGGLGRSLRTPLDGLLSLRPAGGLFGPFQVSIWSAGGNVLRSSRRLSFRRQLNFTVCGQSRLRVLLQPRRGSRAPVPLLIQRP